MLAKLKRIIISVAAALALTAPALVPVAVYAQVDIGGSLECGTEAKLQTGGCDTGTEAGTAGLQALIEKIINIFSIIVGVIAVIMIIVGGLKYITSGGDSGNVSSAKNTIIYALVGLVIVALAQFIVRFVLGSANDAATGV